MDRLTRRNNENEVVINELDFYVSMDADDWQRIANKLANRLVEFEDIELEPEEICKLKSDLKKAYDCCAELQNQLFAEDTDDWDD